MKSFADIFKHLAPNKYKNLISKKCFNKLLSVYDLFSPLASRVFGFETRLENSDAIVDTALCVLPGTIKKLFTSGESILNSTHLFADSFWQSIIKFMNMWATDKEKSAEYTHNTWFTFDYKSITQDHFLPGFYIGIKEEKYGKNNDVPGILAFMHVLCDLFYYKTKMNALLETISLFLNKLPPSSYIKYIGFMPARSKDLIRISVLLKNFNDVHTFINDIGVKETIKNDFLSAIQKYFSYVDYGILHIDIGKEIDTRIGIELRYASRELRLFSQYRWKQVIDKLCENKLCTKEKEKDIIHWPGMEKGWISIDDCQYTVFRFLYYIKLVYPQKGPIGAKAYFGYVFHPEK